MILVTVLRTVCLYAIYWSISIPFGILYLLTFWSKRLCWPIFRTHLNLALWLFKKICGIRYEISGFENIPPQTCILASLHESTWENLFFQVLLDNPAIVIKREILSYPFAGQLARMNGHIPTRRDGDVAGFRKTLALARRQFELGRNILIFPAGTRKPGHRVQIQNGVYAMYHSFGCPCVPIVHNSGDFWSYGSWLKYPGTIQVKILPAIPPGIGKREFRAEIKDALSTDPRH